MSRLLLLNLLIAFFAVTVNLVAQTDANTKEYGSSKVVINGIIEQADAAAQITFKLYKDYITFEEINHTVSLEKGVFSISFDIAEPTPGFLVYGTQTIPIFLENGDDLVIHSHHSAFLDSLQYFEQGALRNTYLKESYLLFDKNDAKLVKEGIAQNTIEGFEQLMEKYKEEKFAFLHNYLSKRDTSFSANFAEYVKADINYWWGQNMMSYRNNHPASHLLPISITLPEEYYEFLETLQLNNEEALKNANYLKFLDQYLDWRQDRIAKGLVKFEGTTPTRKQVVEITRVETFAEVMMYDLDVRAKAHDPTSVIGKLKRKSKVLYLRDVTSDRFKYPYGGINYIDHFLKIQMPDGQAGWVFSMGVRIFEDIVTDKFEVDLPKDTDDRLTSLKYANFKGRVLHYAISKDLYQDISKGKRVRKSIIDKYTAASPYPSYNSLLKKAYSERGYNQTIPMTSLRGTSAEKLVMEEKIANFTKNLATILEVTELEQKSNKPKAKIITKQPQTIIAESTKLAPVKIVETPVAKKAVSEAAVSVPDFSSYQQETLLRFKTNFSAGDRPSVIINENPLLNDRQEKKLSNFTTGRAFISIPVNLSSPTTWELRNGGEVVELYYQPGDKINVEIAGSDIYTQTVFSGKGSAANTYLLKAAKQFLRVKKELSRNIKDAKPQAFKAYLDNVRQEKLDFFYQYLNDTGLDADFVAYAEADINYWYAFNLMNYLYEHPYLNDLPSPMDIPASYYEAIQTISVNNDAALPNKFFVHYIQEFIAYQNRQPENVGKTRYQLAEEYLTGKTKDFFKAILLSLDAEQSTVKGLSHQINQFSEDSTDKVFGEFVKMAYHKARGIEEGMVAPNFTLLDKTGKTVQLSDYKGKVVFLDFWATWCGPCLDIMPTHKSLHQQFKGKNIEFLYISMDTSPTLWKNFLTKKQLAGEHLISGDKMGLKSSIAKDYKIKYLPYTLLLDGNGTIVWQRTGGFSVNNVSKEIERLLGE